MIKNSKIILSTIVISLIFLQIISLTEFISADTMQQISYNVSDSSQSAISGANFMVTMLKYDPFPVNAGDSFDLWIEVQNIGKDDAQNARFELAPEYPFNSNDSLIRDYGVVNGMNSAYTLNQKVDSAQIILKFRVSVANDAPTGTQTLKFYSIANSKDPSSAKVETDIPIDIAKTKTDFEIKLKDISPTETSFTVSNIGQNDAKAVKVDIKKSEGSLILSGEEPASLGDLDQGEFTIAHIGAVPAINSSDKTMTLEISYTDTAGIRSTLEKIVPIDQSFVQSICSQTSPTIDYMNFIYAAIGLITGIFIVLLIGLIRHKNKSEIHDINEAEKHTHQKHTHTSR